MAVVPPHQLVVLEQTLMAAAAAAAAIRKQQHSWIKQTPRNIFQQTYIYQINKKRTLTTKYQSLHQTYCDLLCPHLSTFGPKMAALIKTRVPELSG